MVVEGKELINSYAKRMFPGIKSFKLIYCRKKLIVLDGIARIERIKFLPILLSTNAMQRHIARRLFNII